MRLGPQAIGGVYDVCISPFLRFSTVQVSVGVDQHTIFGLNNSYNDIILYTYIYKAKATRDTSLINVCREVYFVYLTEEVVVGLSSNPCIYAYREHKQVAYTQAIRNPNTLTPDIGPFNINIR